MINSKTFKYLQYNLILVPLKSMYLLPHGGIIIPGMEPERDNNETRKQAADNLLNRMEEVGQEIKDDNIDIIFLTSPHGYMHPSDVVIPFHSLYEAWQYYRQEGKMQQLLFPGHSQLSQIFHELLLQKNVPTSPLILADINFPLKIAWGEAIPLQFLSNPETGPQVVLFHLPMSAGSDGDTEIMDKIAEVIHELCSAPLMEEFNVSLIISGDLSHRHDADHQYGYHDDAKPFDKLVQGWSYSPTRETYLKLLQMHENAASCGVYGMGIIQRLNELMKWNHMSTHYELPTYFGMAVSSWKAE